MSRYEIPFLTIDWSGLPKVEQKGASGKSLSRTTELQGLQIRIIEYSKGYVADHWCEKGHIAYCLEGEFIIELKDDIDYKLTAGMIFVVSDEMSSHRLVADSGARVLIIDGSFLQH